MNVKNSVANQANHILNTVENLEREIEGKSGLYSAAGQQVFFEEVERKYKTAVLPYVENAMAIIKRAKDTCLKSATDNLRKGNADSGYQMALFNAANLVKSGNFTDECMLQQIIDAFSTDSFALAVIECAMKENTAFKFQVQNLPIRNRDRVEAFEQLEKLLKALLNVPTNGELSGKIYAAKKFQKALACFNDDLNYAG